MGSTAPIEAATRLAVGSRLLTDIVDETALLEPDKVMASFPTSTTMEEWHPVTYRELQVVVDNLAWYIEGVFGRSETFETLTYIGVNDIRYPIFWLAAIKAGYATLNTSPRNTIEGHVSLLEQLKSTKFFHSVELTETAQQIKAACSGKLELETRVLPTYEDLLAMPTAGTRYPFSKTFADLRDKTAFVFHTSGSTGFPKPICLTHDYLAVCDNNAYIPAPDNRNMFFSICRTPGAVIFDGMPLFHLAGAVCASVIPLFTGAQTVFQPSSSPYGPKTLVALFEKRHDVNITLVAPSTLEALVDVEGGAEKLSHMWTVMYGGGPLAPYAGDKLSKVVPLAQGYGSTEAGIVPSMFPKDPSLWNYFDWNLAYGMKMDPIGDGELCELIIPRDPAYAKYHGVFKVFPDLDVWRTRDLFARHPTEPNLWLFVSRTDDVLVLSTGEKFNPIDMQYDIAAHPLLKGAIVAGQGRFQTALIVEPDYTKWDPARDPRELIDELWPFVQEVNQTVAATGRVFKNKIIVAPPEKPFRRADKGTVQRARTIMEFQPEMDEIYKDNSEEIVKALPEVITAESMKAFTRACLGEYVEEAKLSDEDNFYVHGMDSLQSLGFLNVVRTALAPAIQKLGGSAGKTTKLNLQSIYEHPSINEMSAFLAKFLDPSLAAAASSSSSSSGANANDLAAREEKVARMVEKYTADVTRPEKPAVSKHRRQHQVILTGTTGSLGCYMLHSLCARADVSKIYCFNRTADAAKRTGERYRESGLGEQIPPKAVFLAVKYGDAHFGLDEATYGELLANVDLVIHNAWAVNFNHTLETFEDPHIKSVRNFVDLSRYGAYRAHIFFISSIGAVSGWGFVHPDCACPEERMPLSACLPQGYAQSKHVSERILATVADNAGVPGSIARVGQVAGPRSEKGRWNDAEWFPSIIKTSKAIGKIPDSLGIAPGMDWVPVGEMAGAAVELALGRLAVDEAEPLDVFHLVNPQKARWTDLIPTVQAFFAARGAPLEVVSFSKWIGAVGQAAAADSSEDAARRMPAIKLLDFFQALDKAESATTMPRLEVTNTAKKSPTIANLGPIGEELMSTWLRQWDY